jgi:hypothetical protein
MGFSMNDTGNSHPGTERERRIATFNIRFSGDHCLADRFLIDNYLMNIYTKHRLMVYDDEYDEYDEEAE